MTKAQRRIQKFLKGGFQFFKKQPDSILVNLFQLLMKMCGIIVKQGFGVIVGFCYSICLVKNPVIMILKVVGCEDCVRENVSYHNGCLGAKPPGRWAILAFFFFFFEKNLF